MKSRRLLIELSLASFSMFMALWIGVPKFMGAQTINSSKYFPDPAVLGAVRGAMGVSENEPFTKGQATQYSGELNIENCENIEGLNFFRGITSLKLECHNLEQIDLSPFLNLETVVLKSDNTLSVKTDTNQELKEFTLNINPNMRETSGPIQVNFSQNPELYLLNLNQCPITAIDLTSNPELFQLALECDGSKYALTSLDITQNNKLAALMLSGHHLETLDVSHLKGLYILRCNHNQIQNLVLGIHPDLNRLECNRNSITKLDVSTYQSLQILSCENNRLTELLLPIRYSHLEYLRCFANGLELLDLSQQKKLKTLQAQKNPLKHIAFPKNPIQWIETDRFEWNQYLIPRDEIWPMGYSVIWTPAVTWKPIYQNIPPNPIPENLSEVSKRSPFVGELFKELDTKIGIDTLDDSKLKTMLIDNAYSGMTSNELTKLKTFDLND